MSLQPLGRDGRPVDSGGVKRSRRLREFMKKYRYELHLPEAERWDALRRAVAELGAGKVYQLLNRLRYLVSPSGRQIVEVDMNYVRFLIAVKFTGKSTGRE